MILSGFQGSIWLYRQPVDFRKQLNGLVQLIADELDKSPTSGELFIFRNKRSDRLKLVVWETNGFWLFYRRLEAGKFILPQLSAEAMLLSSAQLQWLLSGLDMQAHASPKPLYFKHVY